MRGPGTPAGHHRLDQSVGEILPLFPSRRRRCLPAPGLGFFRSSTLRRSSDPHRDSGGPNLGPPREGEDLAPSLVGAHRNDQLLLRLRERGLRLDRLDAPGIGAAVQQGRNRDRVGKGGRVLHVDLEQRIVGLDRLERSLAVERLHHTETVGGLRPRGAKGRRPLEYRIRDGDHGLVRRVEERRRLRGGHDEGGVGEEIRERLTAEGSNVEAVNRQRVRAVGKVSGLVDAALQLPIESEGGPIREHRSRQERGALWELTVARPRAAVPIGREEKRFDQTAHRLARVVDHDHVREVSGVLPVRGIGGGGLHGEYLPLYLRASRTAHAEQREAGERNRVLPAHDAGSRGCEAPALQGLPL